MRKTLLLLPALCLALLMGGCGGEIGVKAVGAAGRERYNTQSVFLLGMSSDTTNLLGNYLLADMLTDEPEKFIPTLESLLDTDRTQEVRIALAETGLLLASRFCDDPDLAVRYHLTVILHAQQYLEEIVRTPGASVFDPDILVAMRSYNRALTELFCYLKERGLHASNSFELTAAGGQQIRFDTPEYLLPVKRENITDFKLCAEYQAVNLTHNNRRFGIGAQLICELAENAIPETVFAEAQVIPGTLIIRISRNNGDNRYTAKFRYLDSRSCDTVPDKDFPLPLALDFSIPMAYMIRKPPTINLLARAFIADQTSDVEGLYHMEPHHDDRIPVILVHGLMSDTRTWMQMINTLLSDPVLRRHYRFMGFTYASGNPIFYSAMNLRKALQKERDKLVRDGRDLTSFDRMVVIGHSMGGLLARILISNCNEEVLGQYFGADFPQVMAGHRNSKFAEWLVFQPFPSVKRVIFIAVPHRGATLADSWLSKYLSSFVKFPKALLDFQSEVVSTLADRGDGKSREVEILSGIENLSTDNNALKLMEKMPMAPIPHHSIIGNRGGGDIPGGSDGVVDYRSSHLDEVQSEKVVKSGHSVQQNPLAIQEIRRILRAHLKGYPDLQTEVGR
ncbi:MAG: alpha/beta hydrolase [Lentisphaeria bacterium]|nr:alpha/beta hydrolase [Lentisphaeria bacterium]